MSTLLRRKLMLGRLVKDISIMLKMPYPSVSRLAKSVDELPENGLTSSTMCISYQRQVDRWKKYRAHSDRLRVKPSEKIDLGRTLC